MSVFTFFSQRERSESMAGGGPRKGAGRKSTGKAKIVTMVRLAPDVRARLKRDAEQTGQSLSAVIENHIAYASKAATPADKPSRALCYLIERMTIYGRGLRISETDGHSYGFDWRTNRDDFEVFKLAVIQLLEKLAPKGAVGASPYPSYATHAEAARTLIAMVSIPSDALLTQAEGAKKPATSLYYGQARAWDDLKMGEDK
jgi:hypothetical protein